MPKPELLLRDLHLLDNRETHLLLIAAAVHPWADHGKGAHKLRVWQARRVALARHAHCLNYTAAPQLLDRFLLLEKVGALLRVRVHAAHKVWVRYVDCVHERLQVSLERRRYGDVGDTAAALGAHLQIGRRGCLLKHG